MGLRRRELAAALSVLPLPVWAQQQPAPSALADRMPAFWLAYDAGRDLPLAARADQLVQRFFIPHADDYRRAGMKTRAEAVARWLPPFDAMAEAVRALHGEFAASYSQHRAAFRAALPDFDGSASPVTLLPSLFSFDAHLEPQGRQFPLFFGPDGIVRYHGTGADLGVLFAHELFHCYQAQKNPALALDPQPPVFAGLWMEGVATYASERLNPGATLLHVLLDDKALAAADGATLRRAAAALLAQLDATDEAAQRPFFDSGYRSGPGANDGNWPARAGYYVGLLAARRLGEAMSLPEMAALPAPRVRELLARELTRLVAG